MPRELAGILAIIAVGVGFMISLDMVIRVQPFEKRDHYLFIFCAIWGVLGLVGIWFWLRLA